MDQPQKKRFTPSNLPNYSWRTPVSLLVSLGASPSAEYLPRELLYITDPIQANDEIASLRGPIGFDVEWKPQFAKGGAENPIALVQLADRHRILLIHVFMMRGRLPPALKTLLEDENSLKLGVGISGDRDKVNRDLRIELHGVIELSHLARVLDAQHWFVPPPIPKNPKKVTAATTEGMNDPSNLFPKNPSGQSKTLISLARLTERYVNSTLVKKKKVQLANWEKDLTPEMCEYAANDAAAALSIFEVLLQQLQQFPTPLPHPSNFITGISNTALAALGHNLSSLCLSPPPTPPLQDQEPLH